MRGGVKAEWWTSKSSQKPLVQTQGQPYTDTKEKPEEGPTVSVTTEEGWPDSICLRPHDYREGHNGSYVIFVLKLAS